MEAKGILTFVNDKYSMSQGMTQAREFLEEQAERDPRYWGLCYFHTINLDEILQGDGLRFDLYGQRMVAEGRHYRG